MGKISEITPTITANVGSTKTSTIVSSQSELNLEQLAVVGEDHSHHNNDNNDRSNEFVPSGQCHFIGMERADKSLPVAPLSAALDRSTISPSTSIVVADNTTSDQVYTVSSISYALKALVSGAFKGVKIKGEISGLKIATSGHAYFNLKDDSSILNVICWRSVAARFKLEDGMEVLCTGDINTYPERSVYQLIVKHIETTGIGALLALLDKRRKKLAAEGLFDDINKKSLKLMPKSIGIITSVRGAVIKDIIHRIKERCPTALIVWDVAVQGASCAEQVKNAILGFNDENFEKIHEIPKPDLLIICRGGGSIEDLWGFNDEIVVRAAAFSNIPIISAIGHETDYTLLDLVADKRAPTPTAAAEMAVPVLSGLIKQISIMNSRLDTSFNYLIANLEAALKHNIDNLLSKRQLQIERFENKIYNLYCRLKVGVNIIIQKSVSKLGALGNRLNIRPMLNLSAIKTQKADYLYTRLSIALERLLKNKIDRLESLNKLLNSYSYHNVLKRGFAVLRHKGNNNEHKNENIAINDIKKDKNIEEDKNLKKDFTELLTSVEHISIGMELEVELSDGRWVCKAIDEV